MSGFEPPHLTHYDYPDRHGCRVELDEPGPDREPNRMRWAGLAENPATPDELLLVLAKSDSRLVHLTLAYRENLPGSVGETLADRCLVTGDSHLIYPLAFEDLLPERVLLELAGSADPAVRRPAALAPRLQPELIHSLSNDPSSAVREAVAFREGLDPRLRERLANDPDPEVREGLGRHDDLPESILTILARDPVPAVRGEVIPRLGRHWLPELANDPDPQNRAEVARHPDAPADLLDRLAGDEDKWVRYSVCEARRVSTKLLALLADDSDAAVRLAVARQGRTPDRVVRRLADDSDKMVRGAARDRLDPHPGRRSYEEIDRLAANGPLDWLDLIRLPDEQRRQFASSQHAQLRAAAASSFTLPPNIARELALDRSPVVRQTLAHNRCAPAEALRLLFSSHADRSSDRVHALAENPNTPADVLAHLLNGDVDYRTRLAAVSHPNIPPATLAALAQSDHELDVLRDACTHAALPRPVMWRLVAPLTAT